MTTIKIQGGASFECLSDAFILAAAQDVGVDLPYSCKAGACSTCAGKVIEGALARKSKAFWTTNKLQMDFYFCASGILFETAPSRRSRR